VAPPFKGGYLNRQLTTPHFPNLLVWAYSYARSPCLRPANHLRLTGARGQRGGGHPDRQPRRIQPDKAKRRLSMPPPSQAPQAHRSQEPKGWRLSGPPTTPNPARQGQTPPLPQRAPPLGKWPRSGRGDRRGGVRGRSPADADGLQALQVPRLEAKGNANLYAPRQLSFQLSSPIGAREVRIVGMGESDRELHSEDRQVLDLLQTRKSNKGSSLFEFSACSKPLTAGITLSEVSRAFATFVAKSAT